MVTVCCSGDGLQALHHQVLLFGNDKGFWPIVKFAWENLQELFPNEDHYSDTVKEAIVWAHVYLHDAFTFREIKRV